MDAVEKERRFDFLSVAAITIKKLLKGYNDKTRLYFGFVFIVKGVPGWSKEGRAFLVHVENQFN